MSDDEDEDDLWGEVDQPDNDLMISSNLASVIGVEEKKVHEGEPDEGQVRWVAPSFAGLSNSDTVDVKGAHWNKEDKLPAFPPSPLKAKPLPTAGSPAPPPPAVGAPAMPSSPSPAFLLPQGADGRVDWTAMLAK